MRTQSKTGNLLETRENASDPMGIGFSFVFDWLRWWRQVFGPVTEQSEEKLKQCLLHFFHVTMYYRWRSSIFFFFPFPPISTDLVEKGMRCSQTNHGANKVTSKSFQIIFDAWSKISSFDKVTLFLLQLWEGSRKTGATCSWAHRSHQGSPGGK